MDQNTESAELSALGPEWLANDGQPPSQDQEKEHPYSQLLNHPILLCNNDDLLFCISETLNILFQPDPDMELYVDACQQLSPLLFQSVFGDKDVEELIEEFQHLTQPSAACGKLVPSGDIYFRCLDCEIYPNTSFICLQCPECFEKSNHDGHRVVVREASHGSPTCDCGDAAVFSKDGFCPQHEFKELSLEEALKNFPVEVKEKFVYTIKKAFYGIISIFEMSEQTNNSKLKEGLSYLGHILVDQVGKFCTFCTTEISASFLPLLEMTFQTKFEATLNKVWHDCNDFSGEIQLKEDTSDSHSCNCTIIGALCRMVLCLEEQQQIQLHQLLAECCKEARFRDFLAVEIARYVPYLYGNPALIRGSRFHARSKLLLLHPQIHSRENLLNKVIESGYFENFMKVMSRTIKSFNHANSNFVNSIWYLTYGINHFIDPAFNSLNKILKETSFMSDLLENLMELQTKFIYPGEIKIGFFEHNIHETFIQNATVIEARIVQAFSGGIKQISKYPNEEKRALFSFITSKWYSCFIQAFEVSKKRQENNEIRFIYGLERVFCFIIKSYLNNSITPEGVLTFVKDFLPEVDPSDFAKQVIKGPLNTMGMIRFIDIIRNVKSVQTYGYYNFNSGTFETDILITQIMSLLIKPEELLDVIAEGFFSYNEDLKNFCLSPKPLETLAKDPYSKKKMLILEDFLSFLIYLMNDELCITNLDLRPLQDKEPSFEWLSEKTVHKTLVNVLLGQYWTDATSIKDILKNVLLNNNLIDPVLHKITIQDEKTQKIRMKEQYETEFDPYIFYRAIPIQQEIYNNIAAKKSNSKIIDLVSGKFYNDLPKYLNDIQKNIYQGRLSEFLRLLLTQFCKEASHLLRPALKLVLLNLQILEDNIKNKSHDVEALQAKVQKNYMNQEFSESLNNILKEEEFKDCETCIENICTIIRKQSSPDSSLSIDSPTQKSPTITDSEKKKQAREKMEKLKEEFARKQALFADKNQTLLVAKKVDFEESKTAQQESQNQEDMVCQHCLDQIKENDEEYGVPIYITFTNNFYKTNQDLVFKKHDNNDLLKSKWWPVISSCNHFYHKKCFEIHTANSKRPHDSARRFYRNHCETYCPLCKTLCNNFLSLNEHWPLKDDKDKANTEGANQEQTTQSSLTFTQKVLELFKSFQKRLLQFSPKKAPLESEPEDPVLIEEIFKRAHHYLLESMYLHERSNDLEKHIKLYTNFFRNWKRDMNNTSNTSEKKSSFLSSYSEHLDSEVLCNELFGFLNEESLSEDSKNLNLSQKYVALIKDLVMISLYKRIKTEKNIITSEIFAENASFIQKIILSSSVNKYAPGSKDVALIDFKHALNTSNFSLEVLDILLEQIQVPDSFEKLLQESLVELKTKPESELENTIKFANKKDETSVRFAPRMIKLPRTYHEFNNTIFRQKCSQCHQYNKRLLISLCLICGEVICTSYCLSIQIPGNLNRHASQYHMGMGLFLEVHDLEKSIVSCPLSVKVKAHEVYVDENGQSITNFIPENVPRSLDFSKFILQDDAVRYFEHILNRHSIGKEVFEKAYKGLFTEDLL